MKRAYSILLLVVLFPFGNLFAQKPTHTFALGDSAFLLDGKPIQIISGEMHYPRVPREAWRARMKMAKAMGLNTIGTYVFWNVHEPQKGTFDFSGNNDIAAFVKIAQEEGLWVILRPSPYVCAEWEFGGYPYWLQKEEGLVVRSKESKYIAEYRNYIKEVGKQLAPLQINHGGPILMTQIENEYGFYGSDKDYLDLNRKMFIDAGFDGLLFTCDPPYTAKNGYLPGLLPAVNGSDNPEEVKRTVRAYHDGKGPFYVSEWYPAWFDWWGTAHHTVPAEKYSPKLDAVLAAGISINMYMFHGGTTRGFMNGANYNDKNPYEPQISSYDYDAPLDEAGNATPKFMAFREVISKHLPKGTKLPPVPPAKPTITIPSINLKIVDVLSNFLEDTIFNNKPLTFEELNQGYGFVVYQTYITGAPGTIKITGIRDYAIVYLDWQKVAVFDRRLTRDSTLEIPVKAGGNRVQLSILVENLGRINFGPYLLQNKKGITGNVTFKDVELKNWEMHPLPFNEKVPGTFTPIKPKSRPLKDEDPAKIVTPIVRRGSFELTAVGDTYLDLHQWGKGCVWINGHSIGRYWSIGPQQTLYVPAEWLKKGKNDIIVLELLKPAQNELKAVDKPILNMLQQNTN